MVLRGRRLGGRGIGEGLHRGPPKEANSEPKTAEVAAGRRSAARSVALLLASPFRLDQEWASSKTLLHSGQDVNVSRAGACSCASIHFVEICFVVFGGAQPARLPMSAWLRGPLLGGG